MNARVRGDTALSRPNIRYRIAEKSEPRRQLLDFLGEHKGEAGIVIPPAGTLRVLKSNAKSGALMFYT